MKKVLCVLLTAFLLIGFSACDNAAKPSEPDSKPQSSSEQSSSDSEPEVKKELNQDLLSDIGLTYSQLVEKHGKLIEAGTTGGGVYYAFQNSPFHYAWSMDSDIEWDKATWKFDSQKNIYDLETILPPKSEAKCFYIDHIKPQDLFTDINLPTSFDELKNIYKIENINFEAEPGMDDYYWASFSHNNISITFATKKLNVIDDKTAITIIKKR